MNLLPPLATLTAWIRAALHVAPDGTPTVVYGHGAVAPRRARRAAAVFYREARVIGVDSDTAVERAADVLIPGWRNRIGYERAVAFQATRSFICRVSDQAARQLHPAVPARV